MTYHYKVTQFMLFKFLNNAHQTLETIAPSESQLTNLETLWGKQASRHFNFSDWTKHVNQLKFIQMIKPS